MQNTVRNFRWLALVASLVTGAAVADKDPVGEADGKPASSIKSDWSELIQPSPATADQQQRDRFASFADSLANESFSEAEIAAKQMVEEVTADAADATFARARALHNLAIAQQLQGNHQSAVQNYSAAVAVIASDADNLSLSLILPLRGLASAQLDAGRPDEAFAAYARALHVSRVNHGPHSLKQLPILNSRMQLHLDQRDLKSTLDMLERIHILYRRKFPRDSQELLPLYQQRAALYARLKMPGDAYNAWRHILIIQQKHYGKNDLALIEPYMRLAQISMGHLRQDAFRNVTTSSAEKYLKRALRIAQDSPEENWEIKKDCLLSLADFYTLFDMKARARRYYSAAWDLMSSDDEYRLARAQDLETPVPLAQPAPYPYANFEYDRNRDQIDPNDYLEGEIVMSFTVNDRGRTEDHWLVESNPANFSPMEKRVRNSVKEFIYRPRYVDGKPAATRNQQYRAKYFYVQSEYQASIEKSASRRPR